MINGIREIHQDTLTANAVRRHEQNQKDSDANLAMRNHLQIILIQNYLMRKGKKEAA